MAGPGANSALCFRDTNSVTVSGGTISGAGGAYSVYKDERYGTFNIIIGDSGPSISETYYYWSPDDAPELTGDYPLLTHLPTPISMFIGEVMLLDLDCYATGQVTSTGGSHSAGGLAGLLLDVNSYVGCCYAIGQVNWDFPSGISSSYTWTLDPGVSYPYLRYNEQTPHPVPPAPASVYLIIEITPVAVTGEPTGTTVKAFVKVAANKVPKAVSKKISGKT